MSKQIKWYINDEKGYIIYHSILLNIQCIIYY